MKLPQKLYCKDCGCNQEFGDSWDPDCWRCEQCGCLPSLKIQNSELKVIMEENPPKIMKPQNVMYWCPESRRLLQKKNDGDPESATLLTKANKFIELGCIERDYGRWICKPIKNYNKTTYDIIYTDALIWFCNCQGFREHRYCSHILAVQMFKFMEEYNAVSS